jgi:hypothetical protein
MGGPTPIYTPFGDLAQKNFHRGFHECTDQGSKLIMNDDTSDDVSNYVGVSDDVSDYVGASNDASDDVGDYVGVSNDTNNE